MRNIRNYVTSGFLVFHYVRREPAGDFNAPRHGNTKHGGYSKQSRGAMSQVRLLNAFCQGRYVPIDDLPKRAPGWIIYPRAKRHVSQSI